MAWRKRCWCHAGATGWDRGTPCILEGCACPSELAPGKSDKWGGGEAQPQRLRYLLNENVPSGRQGSSNMLLCRRVLAFKHFYLAVFVFPLVVTDPCLVLNKSCPLCYRNLCKCDLSLYTRNNKTSKKRNLWKAAQAITEEQLSSHEAWHLSAQTFSLCVWGIAVLKGKITLSDVSARKIVVHLIFNHLRTESLLSWSSGYSKGRVGAGNREHEPHLCLILRRGCLYSWNKELTDISSQGIKFFPLDAESLSVATEHYRRWGRILKQMWKETMWGTCFLEC